MTAKGNEGFDRERADPVIAGLEIEGFSDLDYLASGSSADVYAAIKTGSDRLVAVKVLRPELACIEGYRSQFVATAQRINDLCQRSPNDLLVPLLGVGEAIGRPYLVMPFAAGGTLFDRVCAVETVDRSSLRPTAAMVVSVVARGLGLLHDAGLVHRDVKPSNLLIFSNGTSTASGGGSDRDPDGSGLLTADETLRLGDFGLATSYEELSYHGRLPAGTPGYAAPETLAANPEWTPQADIYSATMSIVGILLGVRPDDGWAKNLSRRGYGKKLIAELQVGANDDPMLRHESANVWGENLQRALAARTRPSALRMGAMAAATAGLAAVVVAGFVAIAPLGDSSDQGANQISTAGAPSPPTTSAVVSSSTTSTSTSSPATTSAAPVSPALGRVCVIELADQPFGPERVDADGPDECPELSIRNQYQDYEGGDLVPWDEGVAQCWAGEPLVRFWVGFELEDGRAGWLPLTPNTDEYIFRDEDPAAPALRREPTTESPRIGTFSYEELAGNAIAVQLDLPEQLDPEKARVEGDYHLGGCWQDADRDGFVGLHFFWPPGLAS